MNDRTDLSYFNLNGIDRSIGYEKFRSSPVDSIVKITLAIEPHAELKLTSPVEVTLHVHLRYHLDGSITVTTTDRNALRYIPEDKVRRDGDVHQILIPGIDRVKYPLTVWLYAIRDLFSLPKEREWGSATFLADEFKHILADWPSYTPTTAAQLRLYTGAGRTRGKRNYMEDVDLVFESINITNKRSISVFGVLDGHGGKECAQYCADDIPMRVAALLRNGSSCPEALYKAFRESDLECLETAACGNAGSTANIAVYDASVNVFFIANTGDTRAVLSRGSKALDLSYDRKGSDPEEIARVVRAGGFVNKGRIMGTLAVSRALGDMQLKEQGSQGLKRVLIPDPELSCFYPTQADEFLLIATDGLWDVMTSQAAVDFARNLLTQEGLLENRVVDSLSAEALSGRLAQIAHNMAMNAVSNLGSLDNVTVLIVLLRGGPASCPVDVSQKLAPAVSSGVNASRTGDENLVPRNGAGGWGSAATSSSSRDRDSPDSAYSWEDSKPEAADWRKPTASSRQQEQSTRPLQPSTGYTSSSYASSSYGTSAKSSSAPIVAPAASSKTAKAAEADDIDDMLDFLNDDSNF